MKSRNKMGGNMVMMGNAMNVTYKTVYLGNIFESVNMEDREIDGKISGHISVKFRDREDGSE